MSTRALLRDALSEIERQLLDDKKAVIPGRARLQIYIRRKNEQQLSDAEEECYYELLGLLGLTDMFPFDVLELNTYESNVAMTRNNQLVYHRTLITMMQAWVCYRLGEECTYQVALDDIQHEAIKEDYYKLYGCIPEESGLSPRAGSIVVELVSNKAKWLTIQVNVTCLTALGAMRDMEIVKQSANHICERLMCCLRDGYGFVENGRYPNNARL